MGNEGAGAVGSGRGGHTLSVPREYGRGGVSSAERTAGLQFLVCSDVFDKRDLCSFYPVDTRVGGRGLLMLMRCHAVFRRFKRGFSFKENLRQCTE